MKHSLILFFLLCFVAAANAQLNGTKWKGVIPADQDIPVVFHFNNDTLKVMNTETASLIETLTYAVKNGVITLQKVNGESDCDTKAAGQYKYQISNDAIFFMLVEDACEHRAAVLNSSKWTKAQ